MSEQVTRYPDTARPNEFTQARLGWEPWLEPKPLEDLTDADREALEGRDLSRPYFRVLVRDRIVLGARTRPTSTSSQTRMAVSRARTASSAPRPRAA